MNSPSRPGSLFRLYLVALMAGLVLYGCASAGKTTAAKLKRRGADFLVREMVQRQLDPEWMSARARIRYDDGSMSVGGSANLLLRKDSLLWISVRKLGFEVARAMITPDSVYLIDRLNNEYLVEDLGYLARAYQVPARFDALQNIILGNPVLMVRRGFSVREEEALYHLQASDGATDSHYWLMNDLLLRRMEFDDRLADRTLKIELDDYQASGSDDTPFSHSRQLEMHSEATGALSVQIVFSKVEFDIPMPVRFEIPDRYTRTD